MDNHSKSREELVAELDTLRRYVAELEIKLAAGSGADKNGCPMERPPRLPLNADIEFIGDFDVVRARGVNISSEGICFEVDGELPFEMRFERNGKKESRRAHCIWLRRLPTGGYQFGLKFVPSEPGDEF